MSFAVIAKELRAESGLSQMELSKKLGISAAAIGFLELGKNEPNGATIASYSKYFNVSADYLLGLEDDFGARTTTTAAPTGDHYTAEERQLVEKYRGLNSHCKKLINNTIDTLVTTSTAATEQTKKV